MGIYDREYYRREGPGFLDSISRWGVVCKWLIAANAVIYVLQLATGRHGAITDALILDVPRVMDGQVWRLLTYAFLHDPISPWHLIFNMLCLWWFGTKVEDIYGPKEFLAFYLIGALCGGLAFLLVHLSAPFASCLGASAAIMAIMVVCACHYPNDIIYIFWILPVPIWLAVVLYTLLDLFGLLSGSTAGIAVSAHLGGAAFGFVYWYFQIRLLNLWPDFSGWRRQGKTRPNLRLYREEEGEEVPQVVPAGGPPPSSMDEHFEAKLDAILEKIHRFGRNSLTESELAFMNQEAERARAKLQSKKKSHEPE